MRILPVIKKPRFTPRGYLYLLPVIRRKTKAVPGGTASISNEMRY
jgi:hypothetical protein